MSIETLGVRQGGLGLRMQLFKDWDEVQMWDNNKSCRVMPADWAGLEQTQPLAHFVLCLAMEMARCWDYTMGTSENTNPHLNMLSRTVNLKTLLEEPEAIKALMGMDYLITKQSRGDTLNLKLKFEVKIN